MASSRSLTIRLKRHADGSASITLTRSDGSVTWQRQNGKLALVFPPHDITHFAVESVLGFTSGFYGLVADGWEISDFAAPYPRGEIPGEAREVEAWVGLFDGFRRDKDAMDAEALNAEARRVLTDSRFAAITTARTLSPDDVRRVRERRNELLGQWHALAGGESIELAFERTPTGAA